MVRSKPWLSVLAWVGAAAAWPAAAQDVIAFRGVNVLPMDEERVLTGQNVIVRDERIAAAGDAADTPIPAGATIIEGEGRYLMPGLAEMHAHVPPPDDPEYVEEVLTLYVANGVTTARGMLGHPAHLVLRERIARQEVLGPRLITSGPSLSGQSVASPDHARRMVREQAEMGYDFVKLHPGLTREQFDGAVEAAEQVGIELAGHVSEDVGVARALEAGQATIDHLDGYMRYLLPDAQPGAGPGGGFFGLAIADQVDVGKIDAAAEATAEAGVWIVPTQTLIDHWAAPTPTTDELAARPEMAYIAPSTLQQWVQAKRQLVESPDYSADSARRLVDVRHRLIVALQRAGAGLLLGSDAPQVFNVPGFSLHRELDAIVDAGLTPYQALVSGTSNPAEFFDAEDEFGQVRVGLAADLLLADGNPLEDVGVLAKPAGVMVRGRWLDRQALDDMLAEIAARHSR